MASATSLHGGRTPAGEGGRNQGPGARPRLRALAARSVGQGSRSRLPRDASVLRAMAPLQLLALVAASALPSQTPATTGVPAPRLMLTGALSVTADLDGDGSSDLLVAAARVELVGSRGGRSRRRSGEVHLLSGRTGEPMGAWRGPEDSGNVTSLAFLGVEEKEAVCVAGMPDPGRGGGRVEILGMPSGDPLVTLDAPEGLSGFGRRVQVVPGNPPLVLVHAVSTRPTVTAFQPGGELLWTQEDVFDAQPAGDLDGDGVTDLASIRKADGWTPTVLEILSGATGGLLRRTELPFPLDERNTCVEILGEVAWVFGREAIAEEHALRCLPFDWRTGERMRGFDLLEWSSNWDGIHTATIDASHVAIGDPGGLGSTTKAGRLVVLDLDQGRAIREIDAPHLDGHFIRKYGACADALGDIDGDQVPDLAVSCADSMYGGAIQAVSGTGTVLWTTRL